MVEEKSTLQNSNIEFTPRESMVRQGWGYFCMHIVNLRSLQIFLTIGEFRRNKSRYLGNCVPSKHETNAFKFNSTNKYLLELKQNGVEYQKWGKMILKLNTLRDRLARLQRKFS